MWLLLESHPLNKQCQDSLGTKVLRRRKESGELKAHTCMMREIEARRIAHTSVITTGCLSVATIPMKWNSNI